jgi:hypothetical protein
MKNYKQLRPKSLSQYIAIFTYFQSLGWRIDLNSEYPNNVAGLAEKYMKNYPWLSLDLSGKSISGNRDHQKKAGFYEAITFDEVFDLAAVKPVSVKLNAEYTAEIYKDGSVRVGCQLIDKQQVKELYAELTKVLS